MQTLVFVECLGFVYRLYVRVAKGLFMVLGDGMSTMKRENRILELLTERKRIEVVRLAEELGVSQVTVRKDLSDLERRGIISREHGYAMLRSADDVEGHLAYHYEEKRKIAKRAAECVSDGDVVMIESGSCCALLAAELAETKKDLTIITNSAFIAGYIRGKSNVRIILLGGIYQQDSQVMVGPMLEQCMKGLYVDVLFVGADGYSPQSGFSNRDHMRAQAVHDMAAHAGRVAVVTESEKFSKRSTVPLDFNGLDCMVVTDASVGVKVAGSLADAGITLVTV
ncbi:DeoR/GlpR family DNA-binding transcription regulator [Bifidobacterium simiarum]|uniref:DeoR/GlpR family DNA-binding transcription regulator n=1 Tax=Bifidobacterium simiarum TaxID=2045441 RepID=UPI001BDD75CF|nr:DeoR/GlpR transcriptional regulator [Bifidobacterium simiarum]